MPTRPAPIQNICLVSKLANLRVQRGRVDLSQRDGAKQQHQPAAASSRSRESSESGAWLYSPFLEARDWHFLPGRSGQRLPSLPATACATARLAGLVTACGLCPGRDRIRFALRHDLAVLNEEVARLYPRPHSPFCLPACGVGIRAGPHRAHLNRRSRFCRAQGCAPAGAACPRRPQPPCAPMRAG